MIDIKYSVGGIHMLSFKTQKGFIKTVGGSQGGLAWKSEHIELESYERILGVYAHIKKFMGEL